MTDYVANNQENSLSGRGFLEVAGALFVTYYAAYYVNLEEHSYLTIVSDGYMTDKYAQQEDFFEFIKEYIDGDIHVNDRTRMAEVITENNIRDLIKKNNYYEFFVRSTGQRDLRWLMVAIVKGADDDHAAVMFKDVTETKVDELRQEITEDFYKKAILKNAYGYFMVNLSNNQVIPPIYEMLDGRTVDYSDKFGDDISTYDEMIERSAQLYVDERYKESYVRYLSRRNLIEQFEKGNSMPQYVCRIHSSQIGWHFRKYVAYLSRDDRFGNIYAMLVIYDVSEEFKQKRIENILSALSNDYSCLFHYDIDQDEIIPYLVNDYMRSALPETNRECDYKTANEAFINKFVYEDDRELVRDCMRITNLMARLIKQHSMTLEFRDVNGCYCEIKAALADDFQKTIVIGFANKDESIRKRKESEAALKKDYDIIRTLASEYTSLFYVSVQDRIIVPCTMSDRIDTTFSELLNQGMDYEQALSLFVNVQNYVKDKESIIEQAAFENVLKELRHKKRYDILNRKVSQEGVAYIKISFVKVEGDDEEPTAFVLGFNFEFMRVIGEFVNKQLMDEFDVVLLTEIDARKMFIIKSPPHGFGLEGLVNAPYKVLCERMAAMVAPQFRNLWLNFSSVEYLQEYIGDGDKREFVFNMPTAKPAWRRGVFRVIDRDANGNINTILFSSIGLDNVTIDMMQVENKIKSALVSRYDSIFAVDYEKDSLMYSNIKDDPIAEGFRKYLERGASLREATEVFVENYVAEQDQERVRSTVLHPPIVDGNTAGNNYSITFLSQYGGKCRYRDLYFIKPTEEDDDKYRIVIAFADADSRVRNEMKKAEELQAKNEVLFRMNEDVVELLGNVVEGRDLESGQHIRRVKNFTRILARQVMNDMPETGLDEEMVGRIATASAMHDVGKIMIPDAVLLKPGKLTSEEFELMKTHCVRGCEILEKAPSDWSNEYYDTSMEICRSHHEKYDGSGYPDGLKGDEIPLSAQIVAVADCFDALVTKRVYKPAFTCEKAYEMIRGGECGVFSDKIMKCFDHCKADFFEEYRLSKEDEQRENEIKGNEPDEAGYMLP